MREDRRSKKIRTLTGYNMKAAVFYGPGDMRLEEVPKPEIREHEVLIRVKACGVCGTDIHIYAGGEGPAAMTPPVILGHEFSGDVVEIGPGVTGIAIGDKVAVDPNIYCGRCRYCREGKAHLCDNLRNIGIVLNGGFAEYCAVPYTQVYKMPADMDYVEGAMVEPVACCLHGADMAHIKSADSVLILGGGAIGLIHAQLAALAGAAMVIISEPSAFRRDLAKKLGFEHVIDPMRQDLGQLVKELTDGGADVVIEAAGLAHTARQAFELVKKGGTLVQFGVVDASAEIMLKPFGIYQKELRWVGSFINPYTNARALRLLSADKIEVLSLITHRYRLEDIHEALAPDKGGNRVKAMVML